MIEQKKWKPEPTQKKRGGHRKAKRVGKFNFRKMENSTNQVSVKTGEWVLTFLITGIPLVGFIMLFVWAFGSGTNESKLGKSSPNMVCNYNRHLRTFCSHFWRCTFISL